MLINEVEYRLGNLIILALGEVSFEEPVISHGLFKGNTPFKCVEAFCDYSIGRHGKFDYKSS